MNELFAALGFSTPYLLAAVPPAVGLLVYAYLKRGNNREMEDILPLEEYIKNRYLQGPKAGAKPLLSQQEVGEIISCCRERLKRT